MYLRKFTTKILPIILTLTTVTSLTILSLLYAKGYRLNFNYNNKSNERLKNQGKTPKIAIKRTGILAVRSIPEGAKIYLNNELKEITNATITSLDPGEYNLRVEKEGFETWEKKIQVYQDLVTDITAVLILKGSGLNPLTNSGVTDFALSDNGELLAYTSKGIEKPGLWVLKLSNNPINIFQNTKKVVAIDKPSFLYSLGNNIQWSPDNEQILIQSKFGSYYLLSLQKPANQSPLVLKDATEILKKWELKRQKDKKSIVESLDIDKKLKEIAISKKAIWSPDGEKFYTLIDKGDKKELYTYNYEKPLQVGEKRENLTYIFEKSKEDIPNIFWYSDSKHLIFVYKNSLKLIEIDGNNLTEIFNGLIIGKKAYPTPFGDRLIILSKFKEDAPANLYTVSIR